MTISLRVFKAGCLACGALTLASISATGQQMPRTTKEVVAGAPTVSTRQASGTVLYAEGSTLVVRMSTGEVRTFNVPDSTKFNIDGQDMAVRDLKPGTKLQATVTTTTTPVTERTTTVGSGTVWY